jgi:hypothetical protein
MPAGGLRQGGGAKEDCGPQSGPRLWCRVRQTLPPVRTGYVVDLSVVQCSAEKRSRLISRMGFECAALKEVGCQPAVCGFAAGRKCEGGLRTTEWSATLAPRPATLPPVSTGYVVDRHQPVRPNRCQALSAFDTNLPKSPKLRFFRGLSMLSIASISARHCWPFLSAFSAGGLGAQSVPGTFGS